MNEILDFWFKELGSANWYKKSDELDQRIKQRYEPTYKQVVAGETAHWREHAEGRLAEIVVLDQFSRNMYRDTAAAFANDPLALALAQEAVRSGADKLLEDQQRSFLYMPYMHSESLKVHEAAMVLFSDLPALGFEKKHKAIIDQFGRYPYRNAILGRESTPEELDVSPTSDAKAFRL